MKGSSSTYSNMTFNAFFVLRLCFFVFTITASDVSIALFISQFCVQSTAVTQCYQMIFFPPRSGGCGWVDRLAPFCCNLIRAQTFLQAKDLICEVALLWRQIYCCEVWVRVECVQQVVTVVSPAPGIEKGSLFNVSWFTNMSKLMKACSCLRNYTLAVIHLSYFRFPQLCLFIEKGCLFCTKHLMKLPQHVRLIVALWLYSESVFWNVVIVRSSLFWVYIVLEWQQSEM